MGNKNTWENIKAIFIIIFFLSVFVFFIFGMFRIVGVPFKHDEYCELRYGKGFEDTTTEVTGIQTCIRIDLESQTAEKRYHNLSDYFRDCDHPEFFDITDWNVECKLTSQFK